MPARLAKMLAVGTIPTVRVPPQPMREVDVQRWLTQEFLNTLPAPDRVILRSACRQITGLETEIAEIEAEAASQQLLDATDRAAVVCGASSAVLSYPLGSHARARDGRAGVSARTRVVASPEDNGTMSTGFVERPAKGDGQLLPRRSQIAPIADAVAMLDDIPGGGFILTTVEAALNWGRASSIWPLTFGLACCAIEMMAAYASRFDLDRIGAIPRATPRQADLIIVAGRATIKIAPVVRRLWEQMPEPRYVISMGSCATCGGPFYYDNYSILKGIDQVVPVDVYVAGCPPRPEALIEGILKLQEKIKREPILRQQAAAALRAG